ncbi:MULTISPECIES: hypothetical protein [unclassified Streptomyces]|uniref:hypothetical protein n=1 Tax=unclassified Streptomyces TaxID=2593676 RepID=UPI001BEA9DFD|nr:MULTISPECIES: hypothetical protein [unclassified Streptomyces]MBT2408569.1 hypothetical protein [Streptomyces sp. ISL-21]MBT2608747.1 hypothetical protein [Streptomyces sp. ISL-87]
MEVVITDQGRQTIDALFPRLLGREAELLAGPGEDRDHVVVALGRLAELFRAAGPDH